MTVDKAKRWLAKWLHRCAELLVHDDGVEMRRWWEQD